MTFTLSQTIYLVRTSMLQAKLSLQEFMSFSGGDDEEARLGAYKEKFSEDADDYESEFAHGPIARPSQCVVDKFKSENSSLYCPSSLARSVKPVHSKYDLNWLAVDDYLANWDILSRESQSSLRLLILGDRRNANRFGLKKLNLEAHLLLSIGCDMTNILNNGRDAVSSNLRNPDTAYNSYSSECVDNRTVDPKSCWRAYGKFKKTYCVEALFKAGFVAYQAVVSSDSSYRKPDQEKYLEFFKGNSDYFTKLSKRKKIYSYTYNHEISVDSIQAQKYRPHTHIIFFLPSADLDPVGMERKVLELEREFNSSNPDREMRVNRADSVKNPVPRVSRTIEDIEKSYSYLHRAYSLADQYMREIRPENVQELNRLVVETYHTLIELFKSHEVLKGKGEKKTLCRVAVRRMGHSHIPKAEEGENYKHPLLQKRGKLGRIEKTTTRKLSNARVKPPIKACRESIACKPSPAHTESNSSGVCISREAVGGSASNSTAVARVGCEYRRLYGGRRTHELCCRRSKANRRRLRINDSSRFKRSNSHSQTKDEAARRKRSSKGRQSIARDAKGSLCK